MNKMIKVIISDESKQVLTLCPITASGLPGTLVLPSSRYSGADIKDQTISLLHELTSIVITKDNIIAVNEANADGVIKVIVKIKKFPSQFRCNKEIWLKDTNVKVVAIAQFFVFTVNKAINNLRYSDKKLLM